MIDAYKESCKKAASIIDGWETLSKNELCMLCVEYENDEKLYNAYFAAVLYNYCNTISKYYQSCKGFVDEATCIEWMEDAIQYALLHRRWEDPDSSIYNDPNGPDKVINRIMKCTKVNLYQYVSRKKRKDAYKIKSLDAISEMVNDNTLEIMDRSDEESTSLDIKSYIKKVFNSKDYFMAYMIDCILNSRVFFLNKEKQTYEFNIKKLSRELCSIDEEYCERFAVEYEIDPELVIGTLKYFDRMNSSKIIYKIEYNLQKLKHDETMLKQLKG
jgi:hypothetical protein